MKEMIINKGIRVFRGIKRAKKEHHLMGILLVLWAVVTLFFSSPEMSVGINQSVPLMVVLGLITYLILLELNWWLLERFWQKAGLPSIESMVLDFKSIELWKQLGFFWLSLALLLLTAVGCLAAIL